MTDSVPRWPPSPLPYHSLTTPLPPPRELLLHFCPSRQSINLFACSRVLPFFGQPVGFTYRDKARSILPRFSTPFQHHPHSARYFRVLFCSPLRHIGRRGKRVGRILEHVGNFNYAIPRNYIERFCPLVSRRGEFEISFRRDNFRHFRGVTLPANVAEKKLRI